MNTTETQTEKQALARENFEFFLQFAALELDRTPNAYATRLRLAVAIERAVLAVPGDSFRFYRQQELREQLEREALTTLGLPTVDDWWADRERVEWRVDVDLDDHPEAWRRKRSWTGTAAGSETEAIMRAVASWGETTWDRIMRHAPVCAVRSYLPHRFAPAAAA